MALPPITPPNQTIRLSDLQTEFGGPTPVKMSNYYRGGAYVPNTAANAGVPTSGPITLRNFYGASAVSESVSGTYYDMTSRLSVTGSPYSSVMARSANGWVYAATVTKPTLGYLLTSKEDGSSAASFAATSADWGTGNFRAATFNASGTKFYMLDFNGYVWRFNTNGDGSPNYATRTAVGALQQYIQTSSESPVNLVISDDEKYISGPSNQFLYSPTGNTPYTLYSMTNFSGWPYDDTDGEAGYGNNNQFACVVSPTKFHIAAFGNGDNDLHAVVVISGLSGSGGTGSVQAFYLETNNRHFHQGVFSPDGSHFFALSSTRNTVYVFRLNNTTWSQVTSFSVSGITSIVALQSDLAISTATTLRYYRWSNLSYTQVGSTITYAAATLNPEGVTGTSVPFLRPYSSNEFIAHGYTGYYRFTGPSFAPSSLAATKSWWDVTDVSKMTFNSGIVTQWNDTVSGLQLVSSGSPYRVSSTAMAFENGNDYFTQGSLPGSYPLGSTDGWLFSVVHAFTSGTTSYPATICYGGTANNSSRNIGFGGVDTPSITGHLFSTTSDTNSNLINGSPTTGQAMIVASRFSPSGTELWMNGVSIGTQSAVIPNTGSGYVRIGRNTFSGNVVARLGDQLVTGALTTLERQKIEGYLAWKFGYQSLLPVGHPYKDAAP